MKLAPILLVLGCNVDAQNRVVQPQGEGDAATAVDARVIDASPGGGACDLRGRWIVVQVTFASALGATQKTLSWYLYEIEQQGEVVTLVTSLSCGFRTSGTTTVTISDATLEALARKTSQAGRRGTFAAAGDGRCTLELERMYHLRGANLGRFLSDVWQVGDPPLALSDFPSLPANAAEGMEDWEADGKEGITLSTGLGPRYVAQRDRNQERGEVPAGATRFGGQGVVAVDWDIQEKVSTQTSPILQTGATPLGPGYSWWQRVGSELTVVTSGPHPELATCKNVQRLALQEFPDL
jgi:hypothetical protein